MAANVTLAANDHHPVDLLDELKHQEQQMFKPKSQQALLSNTSAAAPQNLMVDQDDEVQ